MTDQTHADEASTWMCSLDLDYQPHITAAKRLGVQWAPWMGDWFTSYSPRNDTTHAEGPWEHWVTVAQLILNDPLTGLVRPEVYQAVPVPPDRYSETERDLTDDELMARFKGAH